MPGLLKIVKGTGRILNEYFNAL